MNTRRSGTRDSGLGAQGVRASAENLEAGNTTLTEENGDRLAACA